MKVLDTASFYSVPGLGSFVSPFGEALFLFIKRIIESFDNEENKVFEIVTEIIYIFYI